MTEEQMQSIEQACARATPGPWQSLHKTDFGGEIGFAEIVGPRTGRYRIVEYRCCSGNVDADFIASSRTWIPELVAEIRRLHESYQVELLSLRRAYDEACRRLVAREQELDLLQKGQAAEMHDEQEE